MKYLLLSILVLLATQPLQASVCDVVPGSSQQNCRVMAHCGAAPAGLATLNPAIVSSWLSITSGKMPALSQVPPNQFSSPPFRPPIP